MLHSLSMRLWKHTHHTVISVPPTSLKVNVMVIVKCDEAHLTLSLPSEGLCLVHAEGVTLAQVKGTHTLQYC